MEEIKAGMKAPDFLLEDYRGNPFVLSDFKGREQVILFLLRGLDCPNSVRYLDGLRNEYPRFQSQNAVVAAVGQHSPAEFSAIWKASSLPFIGLPDHLEKVARLYSQKNLLNKLGRLAAIFIVNAFGTVTYTHYCAGIFDYPSNEILVSVLEDNNSDFQFSFGLAPSQHDPKQVSPFTQG